MSYWQVSLIPRLPQNVNVYTWGEPAILFSREHDVPGSLCLHNFNVHVPERGSLGTRLGRYMCIYNSLGSRLRMNSMGMKLVSWC